MRWTHPRRDTQGSWVAIDEIRACIDDMQIADEVAEKVKLELDRRGQLHLTWIQKAGALALALLTSADLIQNLIKGV